MVVKNMTPPKLSDEKIKSIKNHIKQKALDVFTSKGFYKTSIDDIVTPKYSKGTIYNYFGSKEGLYLAIMDDLRENWANLFDSPVIQGKDNKEKLGKLVRFYFQNYFCSVETVSTALYHPNPDIIKSLQEDYQIHLLGLESIIKAGIEQNEFDGSVDPHKLALLFHSTCQGLQIYNHVLKEEFNWSDLAETVLNMLYHELQKKP